MQLEGLGERDLRGQEFGPAREFGEREVLGERGGREGAREDEETECFHAIGGGTGWIQVGAEADLYVAQYNVWMHHVLTPSGERLFPKGLRLISHWNLRDELKANYADPQGLQKQRLITKVMERIVTQSIPAAVIDNPHVDWEPVVGVGEDGDAHPAS